MTNKKDKSKLVLLDIDSFGIEENLNSNLNFYKFVSLDNWKKLISFRNSSKILEYKSKGSTYQNEFYDSFGIKSNVTNSTFVDFTLQFQAIYNEITKKAVDGVIGKTHIFIYLNNNFINFYLPIFNNFLRQLNLFLFENKFQNSDNNFFHLNLIIEKPTNNIEHFDNKINSLILNNFYCLINSITIKDGFNDEFYLKDQIENYFNKVVLQEQTTTFYSVQDFLYEDVIQKAAEDVITISDFTYSKIANNDLVLFFNFDYDTLNSLSTSFDILFEKNQINALNVSLNFELKQVILNKTDNEINQIIDKKEHKTMVIGKQNISFLKKIFFGNNRFNYVSNWEFQNSYQYIYNSAKLFFEKLEENLGNNNIILANWNILTEAKRYFSFKEWIYALAVFDFYIYKIVKLLEKNKIRWSIFSTSFGFEKSFTLTENDSVTVPYLSNQFYSNIKGYTHGFWNDFKTSLFSQIKSTDRTSLKNNKVEKVKLRKYLFMQQKELSLVESYDDVLKYIKKWMPKINTSEYQTYIDKMNDTSFINLTFPIQEIIWDKFADVSRRRINLHNTLGSMYIEEKQMYEDKFLDSDKLLYKLVMFYYQNYKTIKTFQDPKHLYKTSTKVFNSSNSLKSNNTLDLTSAYSAYSNHIINLQEVIIASQEEQLGEKLDVQFFKNKFIDVQNDLRSIRLMKLNKFKDEEFRFNQAMILRNKKNELLLKKLKKWETLYNQASEEENQEYQKDFDIKEGIKPQITKKDFTEIIEIEEEVYTESEDDF